MMLVLSLVGGCSMLYLIGLVLMMSNLFVVCIVSVSCFRCALSVL